jgi:16S rRNA (cytosine1402-N4)-methyltransferase
MEALETFLMHCSEVMETGGRLVVMSYHSLEDRMVKNYLNTGKVYGDLEKDFYSNPIRPFAVVTRKPITAGVEELEQNNRARSAKLRIAERI